STRLAKGTVGSDGRAGCHDSEWTMSKTIEDTLVSFGGEEGKGRTKTGRALAFSPTFGRWEKGGGRREGGGVGNGGAGDR
ncbi:hypothetical protein L249_1194, partial [Ophiocordyceps polyrhachis-furcata BCC 54312]